MLLDLSEGDIKSFIDSDTTLIKKTTDISLKHRGCWDVRQICDIDLE